MFINVTLFIKPHFGENKDLVVKFYFFDIFLISLLNTGNLTTVDEDIQQTYDACSSDMKTFGLLSFVLADKGKEFLKYSFEERRNKVV